MLPILPTVKVVLPYVGPILDILIPKFMGSGTAQQINELQDAVRTNTESTKALAKAIEEVARANDITLKRIQLIAFASLFIAILSLVVAILAWSR